MLEAPKTGGIGQENQRPVGSAASDAGGQRQPEAPDQQPRAAFVRVPVDHLGQALDYGPASVYAVRLLLEKHRHSPSYVLNQSNLAKKRAVGGIQMSQRAFKLGICVLRSGPLSRGPGGRRRGGRGAFAIESLAPSSRGYVAIDEHILGLPFKVVAFVAATLLNPQPRPARQVAERIGLRGKASISRLIEQALAGGHISAVKRRGGWIVARPGVDLSTVENDPVENGPAENDPTHSSKKQGHRTKKKAHSTKRVLAQEEETHSPQESLVEGARNDSPEGGLAEELIADLRSADRALALARYLLTLRGISPLLALMDEHGTTLVRTVVMNKLIACTIDGVDPGKVTSWRYFKGAIDCERRRIWMEENRLRPGDTGNRHRRAGL